MAINLDIHNKNIIKYMFRYMAQILSIIDLKGKFTTYVGASFNNLCGFDIEYNDSTMHELHETCHFVAFIVLVNSHQR